MTTSEFRERLEELLDDTYGDMVTDDLPDNVYALLEEYDNEDN